MGVMPLGYRYTRKIKKNYSFITTRKDHFESVIKDENQQPASLSSERQK